MRLLSLSASAQNVVGVLSAAREQAAEEIPADLILQSGHAGRITGLVFSSQGNMLASASDDRTIQLWDVAQGRQVFCLRGHGGAIRALAFSADGSHLASGADDHTVRLWDVRTGKPLATLQTSAESTVHLAFSPDGAMLVTAGGDSHGDGAGPVTLWDAGTGRQIRTIEQKVVGVTKVFFSSDGLRVTIAEQYGDMEMRGSIKTYDHDTGRVVATRAAVLKAATDDGSRIAVEQGGGEQTAVVEDSSGKRSVARSGEKVGPLVFSPGGGWLAYSPYPYGGATVQRSDGGEARTVNVDGNRAWHFETLAVSAEGRWLASAGNGPNIEIWDMRAGLVAHTLSGQFGVNAVAFDSKTRRLAVGSAGDGEGALRVWDLATQTTMPSVRFDRSMVGAAFSPDGKSLAVSSPSLQLLAIGSDVPVRSFGCGSDVVIAPVFSPDGKLVAGNCRGVVTVWSVNTGGEFLHFGEANMLNASPVAFSPNGRLLAAGGPQELRIYDLAARRMVVTWPTTAPVSAIAFSSDGRRVSAGTRVQLRARQSGGTMALAPVPGQAASVSVWDVASGQRVWSAPAGQWVSAILFSTDDKFALVSSGEDWEGTGSVRSFDASTGQVTRTPVARVDVHGAAAFSPDGQWFAVGARHPGRGVRLWRVQ